MSTCKFFQKCSLLFLAILLLSSLSFAQVESVVVTNADLQPLLGMWSGTMFSVDKSDDTTLTRTDVNWNITESDSGLVMTSAYLDEGGNPETNTNLMSLSGGGKRIRMEDKIWMVWAMRKTENGTTIVFQGPGQDNNRKAQITNILYMSIPDSSRQDSVVLTKKVLYENAGYEVTRNQFRLGRVKE